MVWQQALYLVNLLCKFVPCDYNFPYPDTTLSEPQALKDLITIGYDEKDKDNPGSLRIGGGDGHGWGEWSQVQHVPEIDYTENDPLVAITKTGKLRGYWMRVVGGRKIRAFEGIPYAEAPTGYFRFSEPSPKVPWAGLLWANKKGPKCLQFSQIELKRIVGSEDCLCLNIYAPQVQNGPFAKKEVDRFPVMIYIHGGGFQIGGGNDYGPSYLLQQDVILVTFNYRVGVFGFMSTGDKASPGNYGLKDQAMAIQWVYENIAVFNGDHLRITLLGQEAGGASVHLQMLSLRARPFFQAGVSMSGTAFNPWVFCTKDAARDLTKYYAKKLKCPVHSSEAIVSCLRRADAAELAKTQIKFLDDLPIPIYLFRPVLEDVEQKEPPFITESPEQIYRNNLVARIPWIAGFTEDEGLTFLLPSVFRGTVKQLRGQWNHLAPDFLDYQNLNVDQDDVTKKINWLYFKQKTPLTATIKTFSDALSLRFTVGGVHKALQAHSTIAPTYGYMFSYNGKYNLATLAGIKPHEWGVGQGEDIFYLLNSTHLYQGFLKTDHEMILSKIMVNLFGNFVSKRFPTFTLENREDFQIWNPITDPRNMSFLLIHKKIKMIPEPYLKQSIYWESIGLPDTTPYINTTEHYRDYHFITATLPPPPPPRIFYSVSTPDIFDLRANLSLRQARPLPGTKTETYTEKSKEVQHSEPTYKHEDDLDNIFDSGQTRSNIPTKFANNDVLSKPKPKETSTTTTSTTTTSPSIISESPPFDEDLVFLPPWNPYDITPLSPTVSSISVHSTTEQSTTTTTSSLISPTESTTTEGTTTTALPDELELDTPPPDASINSTPTVAVNDDSTSTVEPDFQNYGNELTNKYPDATFPSVPLTPDLPNSFDLLTSNVNPTDTHSSNDDSTTTTTEEPDKTDSITPHPQKDPSELPIGVEEDNVDKLALSFKQDAYDDDESDEVRPTSTPSTPTAPKADYHSDNDNHYKISHSPYMPNTISDNQPYNIMK